MTDHQNHKETLDDLDALFVQARASAPELSERLTANILAAAAQEQARWQDPVVAHKPRHRGALALLVAALGGWTSVGGLVAASCTGLWIGIAGPDALMTAPGLSVLSAGAAVSGDEYSAYETFDLASVMAEDMQ